MNHIATLWISGTRLGTVTSFDDDSSYFILTDNIVDKIPRVDLQPTNKVVDEGLRNLSSSDYIITTDTHVYYRNKVYKSVDTLDEEFTYMIMPITSNADIIDYTPRHKVDSVFIRDRYVNELSKCKYVLIPPSMSVDSTNYSRLYNVSDLLITSIDEDTYISVNGRRTTSVTTTKEEGKYLYISDDPIFTGTATSLPVTYTKNSIIAKCNVLSFKLNEYSNEKLKSMSASLISIAGKIKTSSNPFRLSLLYDEIVQIISAIKEYK